MEKLKNLQFKDSKDVVAKLKTEEESFTLCPITDKVNYGDILNFKCLVSDSPTGSIPFCMITLGLQSNLKALELKPVFKIPKHQDMIEAGEKILAADYAPRIQPSGMKMRWTPLGFDTGTLILFE